jgi:hypothetical protein
MEREINKIRGFLFLICPHNHTPLPQVYYGRVVELMAAIMSAEIGLRDECAYIVLLHHPPP